MRNKSGPSIDPRRTPDNTGRFKVDRENDDPLDAVSLRTKITGYRKCRIGGSSSAVVCGLPCRRLLRSQER